MEEHAFLSDRRRSIVEGETAEDMGIADATYRQHRAAVKRQARLALQELLKVAASPEIDNSDVFDPLAISTLAELLLTGNSSGLMPEGVPRYRPGKPAPEYSNELYQRLDGAQMSYQFQQQQPDENDGQR